MFAALSFVSHLLALEPVEPLLIARPGGDLPGADFGQSLCWLDTLLVIGAPNNEIEQHGEAFAFQVETNAANLVWPFSFTPPKPQPYPAYFGSALACASPSLLSIGAPGEFVDGVQGQGAVYTYLYNKPAQLFEPHPVPRLAESSPTVTDNFGSAIAMAPGRLLVGAPQADPGMTPDSGLVYSYDLSTMLLDEVDKAAGKLVDAQLGTLLQLSATTLVATAPGPMNEAELHLFEVDPGGTLTPSSPLALGELNTPGCEGPPDLAEGFGAGVGLSGDTLLVGAPKTSNSGVVYVFTRSDGQWTCTDRLVPDPQQNSSNFGRTIELRDDLALIGAPAAGLVYLFQRKGTTWTQAPLVLSRDPATEFGCKISLDPTGTRVAISTCESAHDVTVYTLKGSLGDSCSADDDCAGSLCADGVCCDDTACKDATCWTCAPTGTCTFDEGATCPGGLGCDTGICQVPPGDSTGGTSDSGGVTEAATSSPDSTTTSTNTGAVTSNGSDPATAGDIPRPEDYCQTSERNTPPLWFIVAALIRRRRSLPARDLRA